MSNTASNVLILGGSGLVGSALVQYLNKCGLSVNAPSRMMLDVLDFRALSDYISKHEPDLIFNCVGYTRVDKAESEPEQAVLYNRDLPKVLGQNIKGKKSFLVHYSTDFVFNGRKKEPYEPEDTTDPLCVYGASKLAGEQELKKLELENCAILRTAWLFGPRRKNFVHTMLSVCSKKGEARVVSDQVGSPTFTDDLAELSYRFALARKSGIFHAVNSGEASWRELAAEAVRMVFDECVVHSISTESLNLPACRPMYSVLNNSSFSAVAKEKPRPWIDALHAYLLGDEINCLKKPK